MAEGHARSCDCHTAGMHGYYCRARHGDRPSINDRRLHVWAHWFDWISHCLGNCTLSSDVRHECHIRRVPSLVTCFVRGLSFDFRHCRHWWTIHHGRWISFWNRISSTRSDISFLGQRERFWRLRITKRMSDMYKSTCFPQFIIVHPNQMV